jgi:hypothetical protein
LIRLISLVVLAQPQCRIQGGRKILNATGIITIE